MSTVQEPAESWRSVFPYVVKIYQVLGIRRSLSTIRAGVYTGSMQVLGFRGFNLGGPGDVARREKEGEKGVTPYKVLMTLPIAYNLLTKSTGRLS